jgi:hypothetical protein
VLFLSRFSQLKKGPFNQYLSHLGFLKPWTRLVGVSFGASVDSIVTRGKLHIRFENVQLNLQTSDY